MLTLCYVFVTVIINASVNPRHGCTDKYADAAGDITTTTMAFTKTSPIGQSPVEYNQPVCRTAE